MTDRVYISLKTQRRLDQMAGQTNAPAVAAERARQIIDSLIRGQVPVPGVAEGIGSDGPDGPDPANAGLMRYKKDNRVKNSLKFNLGRGYRLICIREKKEIYAMFVGDHDSSDAWLDHFTRKRPHKTEQAMQVFSVETPGAAPVRPSVPEPEAGPDPMPEIPQEILRQVFRGLCAPG